MHKKGASLYFGGFKTIWKTELKKLSDAVCLADECPQSKPAGMNCPASQGDEPRRGGGGLKINSSALQEEFLQRDLAPMRRATNAESPGEPSSGSPGDSHGKWAATCSPACQGSTIGAGGLNFSVRDGKRWDTAAVAARMSL